MINLNENDNHDHDDDEDCDIEELKKLDHEGLNPKKDHYHDEHHIYGGGKHDDVKDNDFSLKTSFKYSKVNLTFKIVATGIFLALTAIGSTLDMFFERVTFLIPPINGMTILIRYFDILVVGLSIGVLGPLFATFVGFVAPWIHLLIDAHATPLAVLFDSLSYALFVWIVWSIYYALFRNSYIHKHPNKKTDLFRRWTPTPFIIIISSVVCTAFYALAIYITSLGTSGQELEHHHDHVDLITRHGDHEHDHVHEPEWSEFSKLIVANTFVVFGFNIIRFSIVMALFCLIEPKMKILNHRYK